LKNAESAALADINFVCGGPLHLEYLDALNRAIAAGGTNDQKNQQVQDLAEMLFVNLELGGPV
jgi:hypothetical protein